LARSTNCELVREVCPAVAGDLPERRLQYEVPRSEDEDVVTTRLVLAVCEWIRHAEITPPGGGRVELEVERELVRLWVCARAVAELLDPRDVERDRDRLPPVGLPSTNGLAQPLSCWSSRPSLEKAPSSAGSPGVNTHRPARSPSTSC
jgi:hypothetical protein